MEGMCTLNRLKTNFLDIEMINPVTTASGTFGYGREFSEFFPLSSLGAVTVKGVSPVEWVGNKPIRIAETYGGMLNAIGLQNPGVDYFIAHDLPFLEQEKATVFVNVCGNTVDEYAEVTEKLQNTSVAALELNISCPNVAQGGLAFGTCTKSVENVVSAVKKKAKQPLIVKLSPNVTDIKEIAKAAETAGADAISLINTLVGMKIDIQTRKPVLYNKMGGLSGPAIMPVAVRMVYQVYEAVSLPILGMGGISTHEDALEFIMAGATVIAVGTSNFTNPYTTQEIISHLQAYCEDNSIENISSLIGVAHL